MLCPFFFTFLPTLPLSSQRESRARVERGGKVVEPLEVVVEINIIVIVNDLGPASVLARKKPKSTAISFSKSRNSLSPTTHLLFYLTTTPTTFNPQKLYSKCLFPRRTEGPSTSPSSRVSSPVFSQVDFVLIKELTCFYVVLRVWLDHDRGRHGRRKGL